MSGLKNEPYKGQCLCGLVRYEVDKIEPKIGHCHCSMCRKFHGAAFATYGEAKTDNFHWVAGKERLKTYLAPNETKRQFCENCGASLTFAPANDTGEIVEFSLGTLDSNIEIKPDVHIFTDYAAGWYEVSDSLPQFTGDRSSKRK